MDINAAQLFKPENNMLHFAIAIIAISLLATLFYEMRKPIKDPNEDEDTKRINDMLKD